MEPHVIESASEKLETPPAASGLVSLAATVAIPVAAGFLVGLTTREADPGWYESLHKPSWNPPSAIFAPVWTTLYATMGLASWLVWRRWRNSDNERVRAGAMGALALYAVQLVVNLAWSPVFFGMQRIGAALAVIVVLWGLIVATIDGFRRVSGLAALLLLPYLAWVSFATALNATIWWQNR